MFYILKGNNGTIYILNANNWNAITNSLKFYKAHSIKAKILKQGLRITLFFIGKLARFKLKTKESTVNFINNTLKLKADFELDRNCSVLISPTQDKVIINHHNNYFQKFAFGNSYENVKTEAEIYKLFDTPLIFFKVSRFYNYVDIGKTSCHFKLSNKANLDKKKLINISFAMVEFFKVSELKKIKFSTYFKNLKNECYTSIGDENKIRTKLDQIELEIKNETSIRLGLVHRDFKPWNVNTDNGLLIYDFEESVTDGPPLEDLFNYSIAPIVSYKSPDKVLELIFNSKKIKEFKQYLKELEIDIDFKVLLHCYFMERICFYKKDKDHQIQKQYIGLWRRFIEIEEKLKII